MLIGLGYLWVHIKTFIGCNWHYIYNFLSFNIVIALNKDGFGWCVRPRCTVWKLRKRFPYHYRSNVLPSCFDNVSR